MTRRRPAVVLAAILLGYMLLLLVPQFAQTGTPLARTFNSMLDHLLHGRVDVDPAVVGDEGFSRAGRSYAYWGVLPALLRLPMTVLPSWQSIDFTVAYCLAALAGMAAVKLWTLRFVLRRHPAVPAPLARALVLVILLAGAQTSFLRFSLYQEVCLWAGLCGAVFVAAAIVALHEGVTAGPRLAMAAAAGAALLTRVSTGIGLLAAFGLLLLVEAYDRRADWRGELRRSAPALAVLAVALAATALVNQARWGSPFTFADYALYDLNRAYPDRLVRTERYGLFNLARVPFGLAYYFAPVWVLPDGTGGLLLGATRQRLIDSAELPPSSFPLTDPLLLALGLTAVVGRWRRRSGARAGAVALGLALPPLLMLSAISMCHRYRIEFYPLLEFLAFVGLGQVATGSALARPWLARALAAISIVASLAVGTLYLVGRLGPGERLIGRGVVAYYRARLGL